MNKVAVILALMLGTAGAASLWFGVQHLRHSGALMAQSVVTDAEIISKREGVAAQKTRTVGDKATAATSVSTFSVTYRFELADGSVFDKTETVGAEFYAEAEVGSFWEVTYLPDDPGIASLFGNRFGQSAGYLLWFAAIALSLTAALLAFRFRKRLFGRN